LVIIISGASTFNALVKSRHSGENRSSDGLQLLEKTGFRLGRHPGPRSGTEWRKTVFWCFLRDR